jgi:hypothetical protein
MEQIWEAQPKGALPIHEIKPPYLVAPGLLPGVIGEHNSLAVEIDEKPPQSHQLSWSHYNH